MVSHSFMIYTILRSLSARRAWIEIINQLITYSNRYVALREEGVD